MSDNETLIERRYLGDAVYADFDGYHIWLRTSDGISITNEIGLEPTVLEAFDRYRSDLRKAIAKLRAP